MVQMLSLLSQFFFCFVSDFFFVSCVCILFILSVSMALHLLDRRGNIPLWEDEAERLPLDKGLLDDAHCYPSLFFCCFFFNA